MSGFVGIISPAIPIRDDLLSAMKRLRRAIAISRRSGPSTVSGGVPNNLRLCLSRIQSGPS